jgi:hypothetical protein
MYGKSTEDIAQVLTSMQEEARIVCRYNQTEMAQQMAEWMANDRRFDGIKDKHALAVDVMDARQHGRQIDLTPRYRLDPEPTSSPTRYRTY